MAVGLGRLLWLAVGVAVAIGVLVPRDCDSALLVVVGAAVGVRVGSWAVGDLVCVGCVVACFVGPEVARGVEVALVDCAEVAFLVPFAVAVGRGAAQVTAIG